MIGREPGSPGAIHLILAGPALARTPGLPLLAPDALAPGPRLPADPARRDQKDEVPEDVT
jgi:hypothetical protein